MAPRITLFLGPIESIGLGDVFELSATVHDAVALKHVVLSASGAFEGVDTLEFTDRPKYASVTWQVRVPFDSDVDYPAVFTLTVSDNAGHTHQGQTTVKILDNLAPLARIDFGGLRGDSTIRAGETLDIYINAADNHHLKYLGFEGGGFRDSVPASGKGDSHTFRLTVPQAWLQQRPVLSAWARDISGRVSGTTEISWKQVPVYHWADRQIFTIPIAPDAYPQDVLFDAKRHAVYRLRWYANGPAHGIDGVDVLTGAPVQPVALDRMPHAVALSASGDSLVMTFSDPEKALGIVDLLPAQRSMSVMPLQYQTEVPRFPRVAHASGGRFFVTLEHGLYAARVLEVDFSGGAHVIRSDIDGGADVASQPALLRLGDGRLVIGPQVNTGQFEHRVIYSPSTNTFAATFRLRSVKKIEFSASPSGHFMMGSTVYGAGLDSVASVNTQDWGSESGHGSPPVALAFDGQSVYLITRYGYQKVRLSDGLVLEQVKLGMMPMHLFATADGSRLIAVGESVVKVISLN